MKIEKVTISNFRNIKHAEYSFDHKINIFAGPNKKGKTNRLLAIYWAMCDYLFDGSSNYQSLKVIGSEKEKVSVELIFDKFKLKKEYYEKWVKTRGSNETAMMGHETEYYIDDIKYSVTEAKKLVLDKLGVNERNGTKFDLLRAVIDPLYINACDWKILRSFVIDLIGDVSNEDVLATETILNDHLQLFEARTFDTSKIATYLKQQISICKNKDKDLESQIKGLNEVSDVDDETLISAIKQKETIQTEIDILSNPIAGEKPNIPIIEKKIITAQTNYLELRKKDKESEDSENFQKIKDVEECERLKKIIQIKIEDKKMEYTQTQLECDQLSRDLFRLTDLITYSNNRLNELRDTYSEISSTDYLENFSKPEANACPECGYILNAESIERALSEQKKQKEQFESSKKTKLKYLIDDAEKIKLEIENDALMVEEKRKKSNECKLNLLNISKQIEKLDEELGKHQKRLVETQATFVRDYMSEETKIAYVKLQTLEKALREEKEIKTSASDDAKISNLQAELRKYSELVDQHNAYLMIQKQIEKIEFEKDANASKLCQLESEQIANELFIMTKLNLFKSNISKVFGNRIKFTLIETNIKEGSWSEVCYPSVLDKETPLHNGSGSEQIVAGIYIAECIKKKLEIGDLPLIFDECDKLDTQTLEQLETNSQIITTKVDDINYKEVTLV